MPSENSASPLLVAVRLLPVRPGNSNGRDSGIRHRSLRPSVTLTAAGIARAWAQVEFVTALVSR